MAWNVLSLFPQSTITGNGAGSWVPIPTATMLDVEVEIPGGGTGTVSNFSCWLQARNSPTDDTGYDLVADQVIQHAGDNAASGTVSTNCRNIINAKADTVACRAKATIKHIPAGWVRLRYMLAGTSPALPLLARAGAK